LTSYFLYVVDLVLSIKSNEQSLGGNLVSLRKKIESRI